MGFVDLTEDEELLRPIEVLPESRRATEEAADRLAQMGVAGTADGLVVTPAPDLAAADRAAGLRGGVAGGQVDALPLTPRARAVEERLRAGGARDIEREMMGGASPPPLPMQTPAVTRDAAPEMRAEPVTREALAGLQRMPERGATSLAPAAPPRMVDLSEDEELLRPIPRPTPPMAAPPPRDGGARALGSPAPRMDAPPPAALQATADKRMTEQPPETGPRMLTQGDIDDARTRDALREIPSRIGRALRAYAGRPQPARRPGEAEQLEARMRTQGETLRQSKAAQEQSRARAEAMSAQQADREAGRALERERLDMTAADREAARALEERRTTAYEGAQGSLDDERRARREAVEREVTEMRDPDSPLADAARQAYRERLELNREVLGDSFVSRVQVTDDVLRGMGAREIEMLTARLPGPTPRGHRARAGGGGNGSSATRQGLIAAYTEAGGDPRVAEGMTTRALASAAETRTRPRAGADDEDMMLLPGVPANPTFVDAVERRQHRAGFIHARGYYGALQTIEDIENRYGSRAVVSPEAYSELAPALSDMLALIAEMRRTGIIQPGELPTIEALVPNPTSGRQVSMGQVTARVGAFRRRIESDMRATLEADGATPEQVRAGLAYLRGQLGSRGESAETPASAPPGGAPPAAGAAPATPAAPTDDRVRVRLPDGRIGRVPPASVEALVARGAEVL